MQEINDRIKMQGVLAEINQYEDNGDLRVFSIGYFKKDGTSGSKQRVRKAGHVYKPKEGQEVKSKFSYNIKQKGVLLLEDLETGRPFSVKISLLTRFNGIRIQH